MKYLILFSLSLIPILAYTQSCAISDLQWKDRILLIDAPEDSKLFIEQKNILSQDEEGVKERKVVLISSHNWKIHKQVSDVLMENKVLLIGLDGGVKMKQNTPMTLKNVFNKIDSMSMRRAGID